MRTDPMRGDAMKVQAEQKRRLAQRVRDLGKMADTVADMVSNLRADIESARDLSGAERALVLAACREAFAHLDSGSWRLHGAATRLAGDTPEQPIGVYMIEADGSLNYVPMPRVGE